MKESYSEGIATHTGPELCVVPREGLGDELVGVRAGRTLSRETSLKSRVLTVLLLTESNTKSIALNVDESTGSKREILGDPTRSENPGMHVKHLTRAQGSLDTAHEGWQVGRMEKSKDMRP